MLKYYRVAFKKGRTYNGPKKPIKIRNPGGGAFLEFILSKKNFKRKTILLRLPFVNVIDKCINLCHNEDKIANQEIVNMKKIFAFTLAEVLVTLAIIGVVSAMTVPTLMQNHQRKTYVTQLHQVYNLFQQAFMQYMNDKNALALNEAGLTSVDEVTNFMQNYFKVVKSCSTTFKDCFYDGTYKNLNGTALQTGSYFNAGGARCFVIASGASICLEHVNWHTSYGHITIDTNGKKGPNIAGRDLFFVTFYRDGSIDEDGIPPSCRTSGTGCASGKTMPQDVRAAAGTTCSSRTDAKGCFGLLLNNNWEMDY